VQSVDLIVANIDWLITVDPGRRIIRDAVIAVNGGRFVARDKSAAIAKAYSVGRTVDASGARRRCVRLSAMLAAAELLKRG